MPSRLRRAGLAAAGLAALIGWTPGWGQVLEQTGRVTLGASYLTFRDPELDDLYGSLLGICAGVDLLERPWGRLSAGVSYAWSTGERPPASFIEQSETRMLFLPVRLSAALLGRPAAGWQVWAGPQVAWAYFREQWDARVPAAGTDAHRSGSGSWLAVGGVGGLRLALGRAGALRASFEWMWSEAQRTAIPGNSHQTREMTAGWRGIALAWELPWPHASRTVPASSGRP
jgi:hypothetical protein